MKRSKILGLGLAAAIGLVGAGYASWTDSLTITNNVETGNLNVEFIAPNFSSIEASASDYVVVDPVVRNTKTVDFTFKNLYPGATFRTLTEVQNKGTIPVKFDKATVAFTGDITDILKNNTTVNFDCWVFDANGNHIDTIVPGVSNITLTNLEAVLNSTLANVQLEPGAYISLGNPNGQSIDQLMNFALGDVDEAAENQNLTFSITFDWKQFNQ